MTPSCRQHSCSTREMEKFIDSWNQPIYHLPGDHIKTRASNNSKVFSAIASKEKVFRIFISFIALTLLQHSDYLWISLAFSSLCFYHHPQNGFHILPTISLLNILKTSGLAEVKSFSFPPQLSAA